MDELATRFLAAGTPERLALVRDGDNEPGLRRLLGDLAFEELRHLAAQVPSDDHLAFGVPANVVFLPGVMGSLLTSRTLGGMWWIDLRSLEHLKDLRLSPDGSQDADPNHAVGPAAVDTSYERFRAALLATHDLAHEALAYDWRKPVTAPATDLRDLVVRLARENGGQPVHLVAHSMGGLVVRAALSADPELWNLVGRIVFIGTPHYGSPAIAGYLKNHLWGFELMALLGRYIDRPTFRSLWGVLNLLPAPVGVYPGTRQDDAGDDWAGDPYPHPTSSFDLYDAAAWGLDLTADQQQHLQHILDFVADLHRDLRDWHQGLPQERRDRMAVIAGVGYRTLFRLAQPRGVGRLLPWRDIDKITDRTPGDPHRDGDGRVPLASAQLEFVGETRYVRGEHSRLPCIPAVYHDVFRFLRGQPMRLPDTPEGALATHLAAEEDEPETALANAVAPGPGSDDPGYLNLDPPPGEELDRLQEAVERGDRPEFRTIRLI